MASHGDRLPAKRLPVDENSTDAIREDGINRTVVFNSRCRSRSFAGDDRDLVGATLRKRSWSVSDSDGCQSSISGEGLENTLVSLVKNEWHSQANVNDSQRNGGSLKGILKHRSNSCHQVGREDGDSEAERKPRTNSVSFVDTKFNESQLFSSSRYRKDDSAATNRGKIGSRAKLGASRSGKQNYGHASIPDGKPPIPRRHRSSSLSRALSKYQSLRTTHNKSPPLSVGATSETFTSRYLTDSGTYTSSLSSDDVPYERIDPPATTGPQRFDPSRCSNSPAMKYSYYNGDDGTWPMANGERLSEFVPRPGRRRRVRRRCKSGSIVIDKVDPDDSTDSRNIGSQTSDDTDAGRPACVYHGAAAASTRRGIRLRKGRSETETSDSLESSCDYVSSSDQAQQSTSESLASTNSEEMDRTLCDEDIPEIAGQDNSSDDEHDRTLSDSTGKIDAIPDMQSSRKFKSTRSSTTNIAAEDEDPLPSRLTRPTTSSGNLKAGKKLSTAEGVVFADDDDSRRYPVVGNPRRAANDRRTRRHNVERLTRDRSKQADGDRSQRDSADPEIQAGHLDDGSRDRQGSPDAVGRMAHAAASQQEFNTFVYNLNADELPGSTSYTEGHPDFEEMNDLLVNGTDDDMKSFLVKNDYSHVFIARDRIRAGRLLMKGKKDIFSL